MVCTVQPEPLRLALVRPMEREEGFSWDSGRLRPHGPMEKDPGSNTAKVGVLV